MFMDTLKEVFMDKIRKYMKDRGTTVYLLCINNKLMQVPKYDSEGHAVLDERGEVQKVNLYIRYNPLPNVDEPLEFCVYVRRNGAQVLTPLDNDTVDVILDILVSTKIGPIAINLDDINSLDVSIEVNSNLRLINLKQNLWNDLANEIYFHPTGNKFTIGSQEFTSADRERLFRFFDMHYLDAYLTLYNHKIHKYLKAMARTNIELRFLSTLSIYRYIFVKGPCIVCPLIDCSKHFALLSKTQLWEDANRKVINVKNLEVYSICNSLLNTDLKFNGRTELNDQFLLQLLFGLFNPVYPNDRQHIYWIPGKAGTAITESEYNLLPLEDRGPYIKTTTLANLCNSYSIRLKHNKWENLYNIVRTASFKFLEV